MMRSLLVLPLLVAAASAFTPAAPRVRSVSAPSSRSAPTIGRTGPLYIDLGEPERKSLTRESEPEEYFATNTDKMSDAEKIPIAIAGLVGISLPFIAGMIALYAAK